MWNTSAFHSLWAFHIIFFSLLFLSFPRFNRFYIFFALNCVFHLPLSLFPCMCHFYRRYSNDIWQARSIKFNNIKFLFRQKILFIAIHIKTWIKTGVSSHVFFANNHVIFSIIDFTNTVHKNSNANWTFRLL